MQKCTVIGNIGSIQIYNGNNFEKVESLTGGNGGTKVFLSIGDHYYSSKEGEMKTRFIQMQGFLPKNLTITVGQLINVDFIINTYKNNANEWKEVKDIINWDVSLRSSNKSSNSSGNMPEEKANDLIQMSETNVPSRKMPSSQKAA